DDRHHERFRTVPQLRSAFEKDAEVCVAVVPRADRRSAKLLAEALPSISSRPSLQGKLVPAPLSRIS
ncbi:MAG TPA: hypothetical protein VGZ25_08370, partial [Gemmataceae bacterium]|nr:hypothetical protein [Gemmataceae bacterium]